MITARLSAHEIGKQAFSQLYPEKDIAGVSFTICYSGKFTAYNGMVRYKNHQYDFNLSRKWLTVDKDIVIGLLQVLLQKAFKTKKKTINIELYESFLRNVHVSVPKTKSDPELVASFERVNEQYFLGTVEIPNLTFGQRSFNKLGSYTYGSDTITMSQIFKDIDSEHRDLLDYVMFHEMLHKVHKFKSKNGRSFHHTSKFKYAEQQFDNYQTIEKRLTSFVRKKRFRSFIGLD